MRFYKIFTLILLTGLASETVKHLLFGFNEDMNDSVVRSAIGIKIIIWTTITSFVIYYFNKKKVLKWRIKERENSNLD